MIIEQLVGAEQLSYGPLDDYWYGSVGGRTRAGVEINESIAMTYSACWAATRLMAGTSGYIPLNLCQRMPGGGSEVRSDERLHSILHDAPNPEMSSMMWRVTEFNQQINWGNCISEIERDGRGRLRYLWPIHVSRVRMLPENGGGFYYEIRNNDNTVTELPYEDVFHVPSPMSDDGRWGKGVIRYAREGIGRALATERYGANWFGTGGRPSGILSHPNKMEKEGRAHLRSEWNEIYGGGPDNQNKVAVLQEGMTYTGISGDPKDSQYIEAEQWNIEDVSRWYGPSPHLLGHLLRATFNNIEHLSIEFVKFCLSMWQTLWEQEIWRKLLTPEQQAAGYYARFDIDALERGDLTSRTAAFAQQFFNGALTLNQWMEFEGRNPIGALGDVHWIQAAMLPLEIAAQGPQKPAQTPAISDKEKKPAEKTPKTEQQSAVFAATVDTLSEIVGIMLDKEAAAAQHAAKKPAEFLIWLDTFYTDHAARMKKALARPIRACVLASGGTVYVDEVLAAVVAAHVEGSRDLLLNAALVTSPTFASDIERCVTNWKRTEVIDLLKYNPAQERVPGGSVGGGEWAGGTVGAAGGSLREHKPNARAARAKASHNPSTKEKQDASEQFEATAAKALGMIRTGDNKPFDNVSANGKIGVEVKAIHDAMEGRVNMRPDSRARKEAWIKSGKGNKGFVLIHDNRDKFQNGAHKEKYSGHHLYITDQVGAARLNSMTKVKDFTEAKAYIKAHSK